MSGWIALSFLDDPLLAKDHFEKFYNNVGYPISVARGAYWLGLAYEKIGCEGMARIDFLYGKTKNLQSNRLYASEINTIPGFTPISMYPKLLEEIGLNYKKLLNELITLALQRYKRAKKLKTKFL